MAHDHDIDSTSGMGSLNLYWDGTNRELEMAPLNSGGRVLPECAIMCCRTEPAPV